MFILDPKGIMMRKVLSKNYMGRRGAGTNSSTFAYFKKTLTILLLVFLFIISLPITTLEASDYKTDEYFKSWPMKKGDIFEVEYVHSVQLTPVSEIYFIDENYNIVLEESYFYSYGAGLPATTPYEFEITEKGFRIYNIGEVMKDLVYRTGAVRANHHIKIKNKSYSFLNFSKPTDGVKFTVKKSSMLKYLVKEVL